MDRSLASLEVLFWLKPEGIKEKELLFLLEIQDREELIRVLEKLKESFEGDIKRGISLNNKNFLWFIEPKEKYLFWKEKIGKDRKIPLDQREVIALLFYEEGLTLEEVEKKRDKKNSSIILSHLLKEELVEKKGKGFFLSQKCRSLFLDIDNKTRMDKEKI